MEISIAKIRFLGASTTVKKAHAETDLYCKNTNTQKGHI